MTGSRLDRDGGQEEGERTPVLSCDYAECVDPATIALRFGDGTVRVPTNGRRRQSFAFYCAAHASIVERMFVTCDKQRLAGVAFTGMKATR